MVKYVVIARMIEGKQRAGWCVMDIKTGSCIILNNEEAYRMACESRLVNAKPAGHNIRGDGVRLTELPGLRVQPKIGLQLNVNLEVYHRTRLIEQSRNSLARIHPGLDYCVVSYLGAGDSVKYTSCRHNISCDRYYVKVTGNLGKLAGELMVYTGDWAISNIDRLKRLTAYLAMLGHSPGVMVTTEVWQDKRLIEQQKVELI